MRVTGFNVESACHPCSTSHSLGSLLSVTKRTVKITKSSSGKFKNIKYPPANYALSGSVTCRTSIYYALVVASRIQFISNLQQKIMRPSGCRKIQTHTRQLCAQTMPTSTSTNWDCELR
jgi:hypothetical protein